MHPIRRRFLAAALFLALIGGPATPSEPASDAAALVDRGYFLLHSFEYEWARRTFEQALELDPEIAMAHCGVALSYNRTIWNPPSAGELGLAAEAMARARGAPKATPRERRIIDSAALLFEDYGSRAKEERDRAFNNAMARLHESDPADVEVAAYYALSFLGLSGGRLSDDLTNELAAAEVLAPHREELSDHPGVLHYTIHAMDATPALARRALAEVRHYPRIAPGVPHAQHMPAHLYFRLGMWRDATAATLAADEASLELLERDGLPPDKRDLHNAGWMVYAYVQQGRLREARQYLSEIGSIVEETGDPVAGITHLTMRYQYLLDGRRFEEALATEPVTDSGWEAVVLLHTRGIAAAFLGRVDQAARIYRELEGLLVSLGDPRLAERYQPELKEVAAALAMAKGETERMKTLMDGVVAEADRRGNRGYMPMPPIPARELYGEMLIESGAPEAAREQFQRALEERRNRPQAIFGLGRAAAALGETEEAGRQFRRFLEIWSDADPDLARLAEARRVVDASPHWPHWRGPDASGVSSAGETPLVWTPETGIAWKAELPGWGTSTPIVWGDRVFVTEQIGSGPVERARAPGGLALEGDDEVVFVVRCFDRRDGRPLWTYELAAEGPLTAVHPMHNLASPSPTTDGERLIAWFGDGQLVALDLDGGLLWKRNLAAENSPFELRWGHGSSPVLSGDLLFLLCDHDPAAYLLAVDKRTGKDVWKVDRGSGLRSYSTPLVVDAGGRRELVVSSNPRVDAYDPATGRPLWHAGEFNRVPVPMPVVHDGVVYTSRGYASGPYMAIQAGEVADDRVLWRQPTGAPYVSSLLYYRGLLYMVSEHGIVRCVDPADGSTVWIERLGDRFWASPVAAGGRIYLLGESGETVVLAAGRRFEVLASNALGERSVASPAIVGERIYVRTEGHLFAIGQSRTVRQ